MTKVSDAVKSTPVDDTKAVVAANQNTGVTSADQNPRVFKTVDLDSGADFPDLDKAQALPVDLMSSYWTPEKEGEAKNLVFSHIDDADLIDQDTGEIKKLRTAFFFEKVDGEVRSIRNASKRLVGAIESSQIVRGTPLRVTYLGKKKNVNNSFKSDDWSVKPLLIASN